MGARVPIQHYALRSPNSFLGSSLHDLNAGIGDVDHEAAAAAAAEDSLDNGQQPNAVDYMHESYRNSLPLHNLGVEPDRSGLEVNGPSSSGRYDMLVIEDITPIENARARLMQIIVDHFIDDHLVEVAESEFSFAVHSEPDKLSKRKPREVQYEGDPRYVLPLMYVANMYETLVNDVNVRLASLDGMREKTIGIALEAAGGLYRKLAKKFPRKGPCTFKRRELATSLETRTRFPELVIQEEKRVRFVVVNGLDIVEKPNDMSIEDAEWFKRLTGRSEVAVTARDYKYYSPRHKYRRVSSSTDSIITALPTFSGTDSNSVMANTQEYRSLDVPENQQPTPSKHHLQPMTHEPQFHLIQQSNSIHQGQRLVQVSRNNQCGQSIHYPAITQAHQSSAVSQHMACLQPLTGHGGGRLHVMPSTPAKFCDECGTPYLRDSSKFCSECGAKRFGT